MLAYTVATCTSLSRACRKVNLKTCFVAWSPTPREQWRISARRCTDAHSRGRHIFRASTLKPYLECTLILGTSPLRLATRRRRDVVSPQTQGHRRKPQTQDIDRNGLCRHAAPLRVLPLPPPAGRECHVPAVRDVDTRGDPERQEELRIDRLLSATTRAATRNEERRRHFGAVAALKQIRLRMQEHREEQQRSRYRCIVS